MKLDFEKGNGLIPVIIQDHISLQILMLGYMNKEAFDKTIEIRQVTFFSRSKNRLWTKGESSGNYLNVKEIRQDCDSDSLLIQVIPKGSCCHLGTTSCFADNPNKGFLYRLEETIAQRIDDKEKDSYTNSLYRRGINKVAQKVGEEAVELILEAGSDKVNLFKNEAADLMYHFLILLKAKNTKLEEIEEVLLSRMR